MRRRCRHYIFRDILKAMITEDTRGVVVSKLLLGKTGSLNYPRIKPHLKKMEDIGLIKVDFSITKHSRFCKILPKGKFWLLKFAELEEIGSLEEL